MNMPQTRFKHIKLVGALVAILMVASAVGNVIAKDLIVRDQYVAVGNLTFNVATSMVTAS
jgi:hypothetical protein